MTDLAADRSTDLELSQAWEGVIDAAIPLPRTVAQGFSGSGWRLVTARQVSPPHEPTVEAAALLSLVPGDRQ